MNVRWRLVGALISLLLCAPRIAAADDKVACVRASETAQELKSSSKLVEAREMLLTCMRDACPSLIRKDCTQWLGEIDASTPTIVIRARDARGRDVRDVRVSIDGAVVAPQLDGRPISLNPGDHVIRYDHVGSPTLEDRVMLATGEKNRLLTVTFAEKSTPQITPPPPPPGPQEPQQVVKPPVQPLPDHETSSGAPASAWILGGVAVVALGTFAVFGTAGKSDIDDLRGRCAGHCTESEVDRAWNKLIVADIALGVGVVSAGFATWLFLKPRHKGAAITGVTVAPSTQGATLRFTARF